MRPTSVRPRPHRPVRFGGRAPTRHRFLPAAGRPAHGRRTRLLAALSLAGLRTGALPRALAVAVLTSAGVDALAPVVLAVPRAVLVIPAGRFPTFVVLGITGVRWPAARGVAETARARDRLTDPGGQPEDSSLASRYAFLHRFIAQ